MKIQVAITISAFLFLSFTYCNAQRSSIVGKNESENIVAKTIDAGLLSPKQFNVIDDPLNYNYYRKAFQKLKKRGVGVFKIYSYKLNKKIESYDFADSINLYLSFDTSIFIAYFYQNTEGMNHVFGFTKESKDGNGFEPMLAAFDDVPEFDFFVNYPDRSRTKIMYAIWEYFIIKDNCMYIIKGDTIQKASEYFRAHSAEFPLTAFGTLFKINYHP